MTIRGVYFLNTRDGWVVSAASSNPSQLAISATSDGGTSWQTSPLGSADGLFADSANIPAYIDFIDPAHGWVVALIASGAGVLPRADLFRTSDGGASWQELQMPLGGRVEFVSTSTGWLADGQQGNGLYVTTDGGQSWTTTTVPTPSGFTQDQAAYTIPAFTIPANIVVATFSNGNISSSDFYETSDGGVSWQLAATLPARSSSPSVSLASPQQWFAIDVNGGTVTRLTQGGANQNSVSPEGLPSAGYGDATFTDNGVGWVTGDIQKCAHLKTNCSENVELFNTMDYGADWTPVAVP